MQIYQVDSFSKEPFKGNPAGVCILEKFPETELMQNIAMEMNLSETAFVVIEEGQYKIRYFTPVHEVPLCGHATLASAHIVYESGLIPVDRAFTFKSSESDLLISMEDGWIKMIFPVYEISKISLPESFNEIIGINAVETYKSPNNWIVARVKTEADVLDAAPDFGAFEKEDLAVLVAVTAPADTPGYDFVVRVFCHPASGITEDPATGSANCILAPYWSEKLGKSQFKSKQLSKRTGELNIKLNGDKVVIKGQAVTVFKIKMNH
ncbi:MAG: PhzF family phenazine biosynthesis protein [Bacteroidales bacterium]|jgi:PhzF family phenazine biosynthesis protein|nr:PhzF family phenazine biosynthesis protein [Bacteroidales bacterium]